MVNNLLGIKSGQRDTLPYRYLMLIDLMENTIDNNIIVETEKGTHYKDIYKICKAKCKLLVETAFVSVLDAKRTHELETQQAAKDSAGGVAV